MSVHNFTARAFATEDVLLCSGGVPVKQDGAGKRMSSGAVVIVNNKMMLDNMSMVRSNDFHFPSTGSLRAVSRDFMG